MRSWGRPTGICIAKRVCRRKDFCCQVSADRAIHSVEPVSPTFLHLLQISVEEFDGHGGGLRMDFVAQDAGLVDAELRLGAVAEFGAGGEECVVADSLVDGELR